MGNTDSVPVISQLKSLSEACGGDLEAARRTQERFARTAPVVSQVNSLAHACMGKNDEALRIQTEFAKTSEPVPVLGHLVSAGYASAGDMEGAERAARKATVTVIDTAAGMIHGAAINALLHHGRKNQRR